MRPRTMQQVTQQRRTARRRESWAHWNWRVSREQRGLPTTRLPILAESVKGLYVDPSASGGTNE